MLPKNRNFVSAFFLVVLYVIVVYWAPRVRRRLFPMTIVAVAALLFVAAATNQEEEKIAHRLNVQMRAEAANFVQHFANYHAPMFAHPSASGVEKTQ